MELGMYGETKRNFMPNISAIKAV